MNLKIGGSNVGKIMYNGQEFGGATKLEPGTILHIDFPGYSSSNVCLIGATKNWNNINGISFEEYDLNHYSKIGDINISGDDFKNLDIEKKYSMNSQDTLEMHRSTIDGDYRLTYTVSSPNSIYLVKAL